MPQPYQPVTIDKPYVVDADYIAVIREGACLHNGNRELRQLDNDTSANHWWCCYRCGEPISKYINPWFQTPADEAKVYQLADCGER